MKPSVGGGGACGGTDVPGVGLEGTVWLAHVFGGCGDPGLAVDGGAEHPAHSSHLHLLQGRGETRGGRDLRVQMSLLWKAGLGQMQAGRDISPSGPGSGTAGRHSWAWQEPEAQTLSFPE